MINICILEQGFNKFFVITSPFVVQSEGTGLLKKVLDEISWSLYADGQTISYS